MRVFYVPDPSALILAAAALLLAGCGFQLRGEAAMPFDSIYVAGPPTAPLSIQLKRAIESGARTQVVDTPGQAQVILHLFGERQEKEILTLSGGGRVNEYVLRYRISFRLTDAKGTTTHIAPSEIVMRRTFTYSDQEATAKQGEEALLYRDMRRDAVRQLLRRLQAADVRKS